MSGKEVDVAKLIIDSLEDEGTMGKAMRKALEEGRDPDEPIDELHAKMMELKESEDQENLVWIDYQSWSLLSKDFKDVVEAELDPLYWNGVFFKMDGFLKLKGKLISSLGTDGYLALMTEREGNYQLTWVGVESSNYDMLSQNKFLAAKRKIEERTLIKYSKTSDGKIFECKVKEI